MNYNERMINRKPFDGLKKVDGGWMRAKQFYPEYIKVMFLDGSDHFVILKFCGWSPVTYMLHYDRPGYMRSDKDEWSSMPRFYTDRGLRIKNQAWKDCELVPTTEKEYLKDVKLARWYAGDYRRQSILHGGTRERY